MDFLRARSVCHGAVWVWQRELSSFLYRPTTRHRPRREGRALQAQARERILPSQRFRFVAVLAPSSPSSPSVLCKHHLHTKLVSRFRSSQNFAARSHANFRIKGTPANL
jgi:hypothetical protein